MIPAGKVIGLWKVLEPVAEKSTSHHMWYKCQCICGTVKNVKGVNLTSGRSNNCGCMTRAKRGAYKKVTLP